MTDYLTPPDKQIKNLMDTNPQDADTIIESILEIMDSREPGIKYHFVQADRDPFIRTTRILGNFAEYHEYYRIAQEAIATFREDFSHVRLQE